MSRAAFNRGTVSRLLPTMFIACLALFAPHASIAGLEAAFADWVTQDPLSPPWGSWVEATIWLGIIGIWPAAAAVPKSTLTLLLALGSLSLLAIELILLGSTAIWLPLVTPSLLMLAAAATLAFDRWFAVAVPSDEAPTDVQQNTLPRQSSGQTTAAGFDPGSTQILSTGKMPTRLGRYQIESQLGKGAMGAVYLGLDPRIGRRVAIKTLNLSSDGESEDSQQARERFFSEATTAGRLNHPGIVQVFDAGEEGALAWIAMEYIKGHDLGRHAHRDRLLPVQLLIDYMIAAADALENAHAANVIHRDLKPTNLMVTTDGALKITDFGIARVADLSRTRTGMVLGTPSYMSPEQIAGRALDGRTDLYSLGVTLYHLLTGELPFKADSFGALMRSIMQDAAAPPSSLRPELPQVVDALVSRAMHKNADFRFRNAAQFAKALRELKIKLRVNA